jgi:predicted O-methyltransferase YrrM
MTLALIEFAAIVLLVAVALQFFDLLGSEWAVESAPKLPETDLTFGFEGTLVLIQFVVIIVLVMVALRFRRQYEAIKLKFRGPIRSRWACEFDPRFRETQNGPTLDAEVTLVGAGSGSFGSTSDTEAWILGGLAKGRGQVFEFGTATGRTTYILARNVSPRGKVVTLTLAPGETLHYASEHSDSGRAMERALAESQYTCFLYTGTDVACRIQQLYGDSKQFDETPFVGKCDLIFIDGSHAYSYIRNDTEKALRMIRPGGVILWHDYRGKHVRPTVDVYRYLNEFHRTRPLTHLRGTSLVAWRAPKAG